MKPLTYMNRSGLAVEGALRKFFPATRQPEDLLVFHDDLDLSLGRLKIQLGGNEAGHRGLLSLREKIGDQYLRFRLGIGRPTGTQIEIADFVLSEFLPEEVTQAEDLVKLAGEAVVFYLKRGLLACQNEYNRRSPQADTHSQQNSQE
jgi:PTH1 family peptidyl-tRNA hydrolase